MRTQRDLVLELLDDGAWHSTMEFVDLGILRAAARVLELRNQGYPISFVDVDDLAEDVG